MVENNWLVTQNDKKVFFNNRTICEILNLYIEDDTSNNSFYQNCEHDDDRRISQSGMEVQKQERRFAKLSQL